MNKKSRIFRGCGEDKRERTLLVGRWKSRKMISGRNDRFVGRWSLNHDGAGTSDLKKMQASVSYSSLGLGSSHALHENDTSSQ